MVWMYFCGEINECLWVTVCTMGYADHFGALKDRYGKYGVAEISADTHEWSWQMHTRYPVSSISLSLNGRRLNYKTLTSNVYESKSLKPQKFKFNDKFPFWIAFIYTLRYTCKMLWKLKVNIWLSLLLLHFTDPCQVVFSHCLKKIMNLLQGEKVKKKKAYCHATQKTAFPLKLSQTILWQKYIFFSLSKRWRSLLLPMRSSDVSVIITENLLWWSSRTTREEKKYHELTWFIFCNMLDTQTVHLTKWGKKAKYCLSV